MARSHKYIQHSAFGSRPRPVVESQDDTLAELLQRVLRTVRDYHYRLGRGVLVDTCSRFRAMDSGFISDVVYYRRFFDDRITVQQVAKWSMTRRKALLRLMGRRT